MSLPTSSALRTMVSFWAFNMALIHKFGMRYPGFGYTDEEKEQMNTLAQGVSALGYLGFGALNAVFFMALAGFVMGFGVIPLVFVLDPTHQSDAVILSCLGFGIAVAIGLGLPTSLGLSGFTFHALGKKPLVPEIADPAIAALGRKIFRQLLRAGIVVGVLFVPFLIFGMTQAGEHTLEFVARVVATVAPFALLLLLVAAIQRKDA